MQQSPQQTKQKKGLGFGKGLAVFAGVLAVAIIACLVALYGILANYEAETPTYAIGQYFQRLHSGKLDEIREDANFTPDAYNSWDDYFAVVNQMYGEVPEDGLLYRRTSREAPKNTVVYAVYRGEEELGEVYLEERDGGWRVYAPVEYQAGYAVTAPQFADVYCNGTLLEKDTAEATTPPGYQTLPEGYTAPQMLYWQGPATLLPAEYTATGASGKECLLLADEETRSITVAAAIPQELATELEGRMETVANCYARLISQDASFTELAAYLVRGTDFYERMRTFDNMWYVPHERYVFKDAVFSGLVLYSENCAAGRIDFTYEVYQGANLHTFPSSYQMAFVRDENGAWMLCDLQVL